MAARSEEVAQTKVDNFDIPVLADKDILDLEVSVNNAVPMTVVEGASNLPAEFTGLFLLQFAVGDNVVKHLSTIDVLAEHVPVVVGAHDVSHAADVGMAKKSDDGSFPGGPDLLGLIGSLLVGLGLMPILSRATRDNFAGNL